MMAATSNSRLNGNNWAGRKLSPQSYNLKNSDSPTVAEEPDPGQLLNEWLGELDNLQKVGHSLDQGIAKIPELLVSNRSMRCEIKTDGLHCST